MVLRAAVRVGGARVDELQIYGHGIREERPFCEVSAQSRSEKLTHAAQP